MSYGDETRRPRGATVLSNPGTHGLESFGRRTFVWYDDQSHATPGSWFYFVRLDQPGAVPIPEPGAALLFAVGAGIVALRLRSRRRQA